MKKPIPTTNITIQVPNTLSPAQRDNYLRAVTEKLRQEDAQKQRDWEMYQKGRRSGGGILGGLF